MTNHLNILLVEDNEVEAQILKRSLRKIDVSSTVIHARDGLEALEILIDETGGIAVTDPFVILLDINMPRMNGHEFLAALREREEISNARVFALTTSNNPLDISRAYEKNISGYIVKPDTPSGLLDVLSALKQFWEVCEPPCAISA